MELQTAEGSECDMEEFFFRKIVYGKKKLERRIADIDVEYNEFVNEMDE